MRSPQKGFFVPLLIIIIVVLAVGGGVYVYEQHQASGQRGGCGGTRTVILNGVPTLVSPECIGPVSGPSLPDLQVSCETSPEVPIEGQKVTWTAVVENVANNAGNPKYLWQGLDITKRNEYIDPHVDFSTTTVNLGSTFTYVFEDTHEHTVEMDVFYPNGQSGHAVCSPETFTVSAS